MSSPNFGRLDRRAFLGRGLAVGAGLVLGPSALAACSSGDGGGGGAAATAGPKLEPIDFTKLSQFKPFDPTDAVGAIPDLPKKIAYTVPEASEYFQQLSEAVGQACADRGVEYEGLVVSDGDPVKNIDQINQLLQRGIGGLLIQPEDAAAQEQVILQAIDAGVCVWFSGAPASIQGMADQYDLGYVQAVGAVDWIKTNLGGSAKVCVFQGDHVEVLIPRGKGTLDGLATGGAGVEVVVEQEWQKQTTDEGFQYASTILQAHPEINVWIGPDDTILGVDAFLKSKGKSPATDKILASGLNGTPGGQAAVSAGNSFIREVYGFSSTLVGYSAGAFCCDWLAGKQVPQVVQTRVGKMSNKAEVDAFNAALKDPKEAYERTRQGKEPSVAFWGNISFATKENHTAEIVTGS